MPGGMPTNRRPHNSLPPVSASFRCIWQHGRNRSCLLLVRASAA